MNCRGSRIGSAEECRSDQGTAGQLNFMQQQRIKFPRVWSDTRGFIADIPNASLSSYGYDMHEHVSFDL